MKVLFAVSNENISESIIKKYQSMYKEIVSSKNVYYFNAILKELQKDKTYDRIVISEDLEPFANKNYETIDNFIFEKLDSISDEAVTNLGEDVPIILIATDRRTKGETILNKLFGIGIYSTLIGQDRSIQEVCKLLNKPRTKKEAKIYYKIDSNDVDYKAETEEDVSEIEIQNILTHYKRLGKNEEKYVESFNSIATQYTDQQLKIIVKFLPLGVKAVLEANCPKYQQIIAFAGESTHLRNQTPYNSSQINPRTSKPRSTDQAIIDNGIKIESIGTPQSKKLTKPVVIPSTVSTKNVKKIQTTNKLEKSEEKVENIMKNEEIEQPKRGRGRPKKVVQEVDIEQPKKKRGRPKKVQDLGETTIFEPQEKTTYKEPETLRRDDTILSFDIEEDAMLPGFEDIQPKVLPEIDNMEEDTILPGFEEISYEDETVDKTVDENADENVDEKQISNYTNTKGNKLESLLTSDKKVVAFVGTTKNGTSFLINNIAEIISNQGIKTAILDLTKNRNSYYIYTKNEEELRQKAIECTDKLIEGIPQGVPVNKNLDVYTSLPGENTSIYEYENILSTLIQNYSLILLDCDFNTNYGYLKEAGEIYLVQSMDVLTIQPLTAYLRDLKAKNILEQNKLRIVINKYTKVKSVTEKTIIGGMAFYNDPSMSFMTELFNRENVRYTVIPFEIQTYSKYLEGLVNCNITTSGYSKEFMNSLKRLSSIVYPLITNSKNKYNDPKYNKFAKVNDFSNNMNDTLNKMKKDM